MQGFQILLLHCGKIFALFTAIMQGYCQDAGITLYDAVTHAINAWVDLGRGLKEKINYRENKQL